MWLGANVSEAYRAPVLAVADSLEDLRSSDLDELEDVLALNSWPVLTRRRFIDAWRELKGEGAAAAPMAPEPVAQPVAEPELPAPAPRDEETLEPRDGEAGALGAPRRGGTRSQPKPSGESPKRQGSDAAPPPDESADDDDEPAVGRRVWALFEPDVWWGGTVVSISGVEDERACSIIFDDGVSQMFYARDVWSSPLAGGKVGARVPNAAARAAIQKALSTKATAPRPKSRKRPKRGSYAESSEPAGPAPRVTPVAPSGNCPICYEKLSRDATVF
jgi:hypothetical protein